MPSVASVYVMKPFRRSQIQNSAVNIVEKNTNSKDDKYLKLKG